MRHAATLTVFLSVSSFVLNATEKHYEDPTKIVTKLGFAYCDSIRIPGWIG